ncbi:unnamed protein product [Cylindrotheca closterium]|uniref:Uncharacterized protein n=1 Tax=Cylindrotheca closterium TaxID=2856 RepID=A0AAD2FR89_9STRA|nr:unnamed protein product [Cylindrotheca closterium]
MGDEQDNHKSPKGKKASVINRIGDVVQTFSPRNYRNKMKSKSSRAGNTSAEDLDDKQGVEASPKHVVDLTGIAVKPEPSKGISDGKSEDFKFFYEGVDSGEFSSPFTSQFGDH